MVAESLGSEVVAMDRPALKRTGSLPRLKRRRSSLTPTGFAPAFAAEVALSPYSDMFSRILFGDALDADPCADGLADAGLGSAALMEELLWEMGDEEEEEEEEEESWGISARLADNILDLCALFGEADGFEDNDSGSGLAVSTQSTEGLSSMDDVEVRDLVCGLDGASLDDDAMCDARGDPAGALERLLLDAKQRAGILLAARTVPHVPEEGGVDAPADVSAEALSMRWAMEGLLGEEGERMDAALTGALPTQAHLRHQGPINRLLEGMPESRAGQLRGAFQIAYARIQSVVDGQALLRKVSTFECALRVRDLWTRFEQACRHRIANVEGGDESPLEAATEDPDGVTIKGSAHPAPSVVEKALGRVLDRLDMNKLYSMSRLPAPALKVLTDWFLLNFAHPYPNEAEKKWLAEEGGLTVKQVSYWFVNARIRVWKESLYPHLRGENLEKRRRHNESKRKAKEASAQGDRARAADATPVQRHVKAAA